MRAVRRAVWFMESRLAEPLGLDEIADVAGLSKFHLSRLFSQVTGRSLLGYLRARRMSQAARALAEGAPDIINVALGVGYGSHEAFTRAFRDAFGVTPESVRDRHSIDNLKITEPFVMPELTPHASPTPTFRDAGPFFMVGIREFRTFADRPGIPDQWRRFGAHIGHIPDQIGADAYGVCLVPSNGEEGFDYLTCVETASLDNIPETLLGARLDARRYAVFPHRDHVSMIGETCAAIFSQWAPTSGVTLATEPAFLIERYDSTFDPQTGRGGMEVWIPLKS